jgi:hypothetical protein
MLVLMAMALLLVRGVVFASAGPLEWAGRFAGLLFVGGLFLLFRENPFAIQPRLTEAKHTGS